MGSATGNKLGYGGPQKFGPGQPQLAQLKPQDGYQSHVRPMPMTPAGPNWAAANGPLPPGTHYTPTIGNLTGGVANLNNAINLAQNAGPGGPQPGIDYLVGNVAHNLRNRNQAMEGTPGTTYFPPGSVGDQIMGVRHNALLPDLAGLMRGANPQPDLTQLWRPLQQQQMQQLQQVAQPPPAPPQPQVGDLMLAANQALRGPGPSGLSNAPNIADLIRMVRQVRGLG